MRLELGRLSRFIDLAGSFVGAYLFLFNIIFRVIPNHAETRPWQRHATRWQKSVNADTLHGRKAGRF